jgi:hypothetical protein
VKKSDFQLWDYMTAHEQLLCDAAKRRRDRAAFGKHLMAAARVASDPCIDAEVRATARLLFAPEARHRLFGEA